jgi:hypothetical protein
MNTACRVSREDRGNANFLMALFDKIKEKKTFHDSNYGIDNTMMMKTNQRGLK